MAVVVSENHPVRPLCKTGSFVLQRKEIANAFVNFYKSNYFNGANERGRHKKMSQQYEFVTFFLVTGRGGRLPAAFAGRRFRNDSFLLHADGACFVPAGDGQRGFAGCARFVGRVGHRDLAGTGRLRGRHGHPVGNADQRPCAGGRYDHALHAFLLGEGPLGRRYGEVGGFHFVVVASRYGQCGQADEY